METKKMVTILMLMLALTAMLNVVIWENAEARNDEICTFFHPNLNDCDVPPVNCLCEIIIEE
tara:strand:- start:306 stop:491 length:186 start_codon:yes stop_codon:yes gene_type:complete